MGENTKIALMMLGDTIDFYNDGGSAVSEAFYDGIEDDLLDAYNTAIESIQKRYEVLIKLMEDDE